MLKIRQRHTLPSLSTAVSEFLSNANDERDAAQGNAFAESADGQGGKVARGEAPFRLAT